MTDVADIQSKVRGILKGESELYGIDLNLLTAISFTESHLNPWVCRYEPSWSYFFRVKEYSVLLTQSEDTERVQQATSWGAMQVMGTVAREHGYRDYLSLLSMPAIGIRYGVLHLKKFLDEYKTLPDAIAAYNAGSPRKTSDGLYENQVYVDKVMAKMGEK